MTNEELSLEQKASLSSGGDTWSTAEVPGIPAMVLSDGPHGLRRVPDKHSAGIGASIPATCFPPAVGLAASWDDEIIERVGSALGDEARRLGVSVLLGPGVNMKRSPMGGRNFEFASEDPVVAGRYGAAMVRGIQSHDVAATPKHFAVNNQETDRLRINAQVSERALREIYLPAFEYIVHASQPWAFMCSYNLVNGTHAGESKELITGILRDEWGYDGIMMSDWGAIWDRVAAVAAGLDLEMPPTHTNERIVKAVEDGTLNGSVLDGLVERMRLLADRTAPSRALGKDDIDVEADDAIAHEAAVRSIVLLKNEGGVLPIDAQSSTKVAVVGEFARTPRYQGGGSSQVITTRTHDALEPLAAEFGDHLTFAPGYSIGEDASADAKLADEAVAAVTAADVAVVFVGLPTEAESEGFDRANIDLPAAQVALLASLAETGTPLAVVVFSGGKVSLEPWREKVEAIIDGSLLGQAGGLAIADVVAGRRSPSGRLTESLLLRVEDSPSFPTFPGRNRLAIYGEDVFVGYRGLDTAQTPVAFPFGHGLTYTSFAYSDPKVELDDHAGAKVSFTLTNTGDREGAEVAQLYVGAPASEHPTRPVHELRDYARVELDPGESRTVEFQLTSRAFSLWDEREHRWSAPAGRYRVEIGASSRDIRLEQSVDYAGDGLYPRLTPDSSIAEWEQNPRAKEILQAAAKKIFPHTDFSKSPSSLRAMIMQSPLIKATAWGNGITDEMVDAWVAEGNAAEDPSAQK